MSGAPAEHREQPVIIRPSLIRRLDDLELAYLIQRFHDWGASEDWLPMSASDAAAMLHMSSVKAMNLIDRGRQAGLVESRRVKTPAEFVEFRLVSE